MRRSSILMAVVALVAAVVPAAWATQPVLVTTTMVVQIDPPDFTTGSGTFEPFESAAGVEIAGGTVVDSAFAAGSTVHVRRVLFPAGGGTIEIRLKVSLDTFQGNWVVVSGTGPYADLHGRGKLAVISFDPGTLTAVESWVGQLHLDLPS